MNSYRRRAGLQQFERFLRASIATISYEWQQTLFVGIKPTQEELNARWYENLRRVMIETRNLKPQRARYPSTRSRR